jgi:hypothetical protein
MRSSASDAAVLWAAEIMKMWFWIDPFYPDRVDSIDEGAS